MSSIPSASSPPVHLNSLIKRISNASQQRDTTVGRLTSVVCNTVIGQMVPDGVVKGGTAMKLRIGEAGSRFTPDFDASRRAGLSIEDYQNMLAENLHKGWGGFSGTLVMRVPAEPIGVPDEYIMRPFDIKLSYKGKSLKTIRFELGHDEIGSTAASVIFVAKDILDLFEELGLPTPNPIPVLATEHQIAQKLHACTNPDRKGGNERAHDLVDLQLLVESDPPNLVQLNEIGARLFAARRVGTWPPKVVNWSGWDSIYDSAAIGLDVLPAVEDAIGWANSLLEKMVVAIAQEE